MIHNVDFSCWSARFAMPTKEVQAEVMWTLLDAGASRAFNDGGPVYVIVVEFAPVLVRRMVTIAIRSGGVLVEMARISADSRLFG